MLHLIFGKFPKHFGYIWRRISKILPKAFEKEMETDADANSRLMLMPESQLKRSGNNPLQSEDDSIIHPNFAAVLNVAKPAAQLDAHSVSSTTK